MTAALVACGIDPQRSRVTLTVGGSPLATVRGIARQLRVYPYDCTEQVTSEALDRLSSNEDSARSTG